MEILKTQRKKAIDLRTVVNCALEGRPINVKYQTLYDGPEVDIDDDREILDEFSDELDSIQAVRDHNRELYEKKLEEKQKGGISDETSEKTDEKTPSLSQE